jgi:hypothetical protein
MRRPNARRPLDRLATITLLCATAGAAPVTRPARSPDAIVQEMSLAQQRLKAAIGDPRDLADPVKRTNIAPNALPPLRQLIADDRELAAATGRPVPTFFEVQLRAVASSLDDGESTKALADLSTDPATSLRARGGELLARWLRSPGDAAAQSKVLDDLAALDGAHPDSDDLAHFTGLMTGSAATPAIRARLRDLLSPMTSSRARMLQRQMSTTRP